MVLLLSWFDGPAIAQTSSPPMSERERTTGEAATQKNRTSRRWAASTTELVAIPPEPVLKRLDLCPIARIDCVHAGCSLRSPRVPLVRFVRLRHSAVHVRSAALFESQLSATPWASETAVPSVDAGDDAKRRERGPVLRRAEARARLGREGDQAPACPGCAG